MRLQPLPILVLAFAAGIAGADAWEIPCAPLLVPLAAGIAAVLLAGTRAPRLLWPAVATFALGLGAFWDAADREGHPDVLAPWVGRHADIRGRILEEPSALAAGGWLYRVRASEVTVRDGTYAVDTLLLLHTDAQVPLALGQEIRAGGILHPVAGFANFNTFDYARYLRRQHYTMSLFAHAALVHGEGPAELRPDVRLALDLRGRLEAVHRAALPPEDAALLNSLVFGSRADPVPDVVQRDFRDAGVLHVLVASGTQVTLCLTVIGWLLQALLSRLFGLPRWAMVPLTAAVAWGYGLMAGGGPSIVRAGVMATAFAVGVSLGRETNALSLLALAALILLGLDPANLFDLGFQLSFAAVWGMIVLGPWVARALPSAPKRLWPPLALSVGATLATAPICAHTFCRAAPIGVLASPAAMFFAGDLLVSGIAVSVVGLVAPGLACSLERVNQGGLWQLRWLTEACARVPGGHFWVVPPGPALTGLCFVAMGLLPALRREHLQWAASAVSRRYAAAVAVAVLLPWLLAPSRGVLRVTFFDVGQGDSALIQAPSGAAMLVDGGGSRRPGGDLGERVTLPALLSRNAGRLQCVLLTHPHADHAGGLAAVCRELPVGALVDADLPGGDPEAETLAQAAAGRGIPRLRARAGVAWQLDDRTRVTVLGPPEALYPGVCDATNNDSIVLRVDFGETSVLLAGDAEAEAERAMVAAGVPLRATVLKMAHHGSRNAADRAFLAAVSPQIAVASAGRNNEYGLPSPVALARVAAVGAQVYRTDEDGAVEITSDGERVSVRTARGR